MAFEKGNKQGRKFTSENQPQNRKGGRKPKLYKYLKQVIGEKVGHELEEKDFQEIMQALIELPPSKLKSLIRNPHDETKPNDDTPAWIQILVSHINASIRYGKVDALDFVLSRIYGTATQKIEGDVTTTPKAQDLSMLTTDELLQYNSLLEKIEKGWILPVHCTR